MRVRATVGRAGLPPMNVTAVNYGDWVTVLTDIGTGPVRVTSVVKPADPSTTSSCGVSSSTIAR